MRPDDESQAALRARLDRLGHFLDDSLRVPGTRWRFGFDALIGLIPVVGDAAGLLLSGYLVFESLRLGVSRSVLVKMLGNLALDALLGAVPVLGDLFDAGFKANLRNLRLLRAQLAAADGAAAPAPAPATSRATVLISVLALTLLGAAAALWLWRRF